MDFVGLLSLGDLDVDGVKTLCAFDEGEDVVEGLGVGIGGAGGWIGCNAGGAGDGVVGGSGGGA